MSLIGTVFESCEKIWLKSLLQWPLRIFHAIEKEKKINNLADVEIHSNKLIHTHQISSSLVHKNVSLA